MRNRALRQWIAVAAVAAPVVAPPQVALPSGPISQSSLTGLELGGRASMDLIRLDAMKFSFPLRYAHVRVGSESVELDGVALVRDKDYRIDYVTGVIYVTRAFRPGQALRVNYRYDDEKGQTGLFAAAPESSSGFAGLKLEFNRQAALFLGMGMTERLADGTVLSANVYGVSNAFNMAGGQLKGIFMVGERVRSNGQSLFGDYGSGQKQKDEGTGKAIIQDFASSSLGGKFTASYQDVDSRFAGFDALRQNGLEAGQVDQIRKERGLKRMAFGFSDIGVGGLGLSSGFRTVGDADGAINWRNYGLKFGGFGFVWDTQSVDDTFSRFNDLREEDRKMLQNERGLDREIMRSNYTFGGGSLSYNAFTLENGSGSGIARTEYGLTTQFLTLGFYNQSIDQGFSQFNGLRPEYDPNNKFDVNQLRKEAGISRSGFTAQTKGLGGLLRYNEKTVESGGAGFTAQDIGGKLGKFSLEYVRRDVDQDFNRLGSLSDAEIKPTGNKDNESHVEAIVHMIDPGKKIDGKDVTTFQNSAGLNRELWRIGYDFGDGIQFRADDLTIEGQNDALMSQAYMLTGPKYNLSYRSNTVGSGFSEIGRLMHSEQEVLGLDAGLDKSNLDFSLQLDKDSKFAVSQMSAEIGESGAMRRSLDYKSKGLEVSWSNRSVDEDFSAVTRLMDPERQFLTGMMGFEQSNLIAKMSLIPNLEIKLNWADADHMETDEERHWRESELNWKLGPGTTLTAYRAEQLFQVDAGARIDRQYDKLMLSHDLGRLGKISLIQEERHFDGEEDETPDSKMQRVAYQTNLNKTTAFETAQSETRFDTGERETSTTNTVSTNVTPRLGLSVSDTKTVRDGDDPDSVKRDYGFWFDFGKGIRFSFGQVRDLRDPSRATKNVKTGLTAGQFAGLEVKSLQYTHDMWDGQRNKTMGDVNIKTFKPLDLGSLDNVEFFYVADTLRDQDRWHKENRSMGITGNVGLVGLGFGYRSQISPTGDRAIDRVFSFNTDTTGKSLLRMELNYDLRTMPNNEVIAIRDLKFTAKLSSGWSVEHSMLTNPLKANDKALLGGVAQDTRLNKWQINYLGGKNIKAGFVFEELLNDKTNVLNRKTGVDLVLFASNPSPLTLGYRTVQTDGNGPRSLSHEFWLRFDQRPGPNQSLSLLFGNANFTGFRPSGKPLQDWNLRLDYGIKF